MGGKVVSAGLGLGSGSEELGVGVGVGAGRKRSGRNLSGEGNRLGLWLRA